MGSVPVGKRVEIARFLRSLTAEEFEALLFHVPADEANELRRLVHAERESIHRGNSGDFAPDVSDRKSKEHESPHIRLHVAPIGDEAASTPEGVGHGETAAMPALSLPVQADSIDPIEQILRETEAATLGRLLADEHPQILAVVLSHLPPDRSAEILGLLDSDSQTDCLRRIASLETPDAEALVVLRCELVNQIAREVEGDSGRTNSWEQVAAVVGSAPDHQRGQLCESLTRAFPALRPHIAATSASVSSAESINSTPDEEHDLRILQRLPARHLIQLIVQFGEAPFAMALATGHDQTWQMLLSRLPRERARRISSNLACSMTIQLAELEVLQRKIVECARELLSEVL